MTEQTKGTQPQGTQAQGTQPQGTRPQGAAAPAAASAPSVPAGTERPREAAPVFAPATDIWEADDRFVVQAEVPGADPDSLSVTLDRAELRIAARNRMQGPSGYTLIHAEYRQGDYERSFVLGAEIDSDRIEASIKDGLLTVVLPKAAQQTRKITVKAA